jgi:3-hydroxyisobutyrate dehydrogenase
MSANERQRQPISVVFVGVGSMGRPMAIRLLDAGYPLAAVDVNEAALTEFSGRGAGVAKRAAECEGDLVITMLPTDRHVEVALFGEGGALTRPRAAVIDMSSSAPRGTRGIAARLAEHGVAFLDAPVSGGVPRARTGELTAMVGGAPETFERYRDVLTAMCRTIQRVGDVGAGVTMKALNNFLSAVALWATSEALVVGARAGLDPRTMVDVWKTSTASSHAVNVKVPQAVLPRTFDYGFALGLMSKDLAIAGGLAREVDASTPMLAQAEATWALARDALGAQADMTEVIRLIEKWSHYEVPAVADTSEQQ